MPTVRLIVEYDGTDYAGWQIQKDSRVRTVQGVIEAGLRSILKSFVRVRCASRTDAGVHARGQVAAFDTDNEKIPVIAFERGLSSHLPKSVVIRSADFAPDGWNPRRESRGKHYRYTFWHDERPSALEERTSWHVYSKLDLDRIAEAGAHFVGTHDFEAFRSAGCPAPHAIRTMYRIEPVRAERSLVHLDVVGNAFCRNMVRIFAGTLRDVGAGRIDPARIPEIIESRERSQAGMTAPAKGLCLEEVIYDDRLPERPA